MTDEESRQAFLAYSSDASRKDHPFPAYGLWQAAVEWATKRERERCARIAWMAHEDGKMRLRHIREIQQGEP